MEEAQAFYWRIDKILWLARGGGHHVQLAALKKNGSSKILVVSEPASVLLDCFNFAVQTFCRCICNVMVYCVCNFFLMAFRRFGDMLAYRLG